ncbi:M48 family metallopeptidase [Ferdinandcohnia quinoae]|uniref:M48 family metallopeptidase n=1 Tax=Fredinandcohnia quinoae TaxID=2918902 RepID=A0AAW5E5H2_9BACI|nr:SprT family zinc-dependent metalloprotease [Fredinandcohnia sp. SECRCQ15]MCH1624626.1 M48 family metallopeptidase [Fredinandcohnia sp. SECRCQ15]
MIHTYLGQTIRYEIKYKNRSSIGISVDSYGNVEVQAPKGIPNERVHQVLEDNWDLIQERLEEMKDRLQGPKIKDYKHSESLLYLGKTYPIEILQDKQIERDYVVLEGDKLVIYVKLVEDGFIRQALKRFYYQRCKVLVGESIAYYQSNFKTKPRSIRISDSKTTWGTCDSRLQLTFNWRLAMAPKEVIDYVVVHEMCHMVHLNHDRSFWRLVGKIIPHYKESEHWLALSNWKMTV